VSRIWPLAVVWATTLLFLAFGARWLADLSAPGWFALMVGWLFAAILLAASLVVRHAESLAAMLGQPLGTLVLTLSVIGIEVTTIAALMATGPGNTAIARDAMLAVIMIALDGMVGVCLLAGGLRHREQEYNLQGANAFLAVIVPLAVLGLVLPNYTLSSPGPTFSPLHSAFLIVMSVGLYAVFVAIQTKRHPTYFLAPAEADGEAAVDVGARPAARDGDRRSTARHAALLVASLVPVAILAKKIALPIDFAIHALHAPPSLGGFLVSLLVLVPESVAAVRAALANELQRAINLLLGSVLASIGLTIPAALAIGFALDQRIVLGLPGASIVLLVLTLWVSTLTFSRSRTNVLLGAVHLLLFFAYLALILEQ
jgi:Ca2+:H+ antiporter